MGALQVNLRTSIAAIIVAGAVTAHAQILPGGTANLTIAVTSPKSITFGGTAKYTITITNAGPNHATDLKLTGVTPPAAPAGVSTLEATAVAGCTPEDATGKLLFPCDITADLNTTAPQTVTVTITWVATDASGNAIVAVSQFTDLAIALDGPTGGAVGQSVTYTGTVTNNGPCPATSVVVSFVPGNLLTFQSGTGACPTTDDCKLNTIAPGAAPITFTTTYKVASLPSDVTQTTIPNELDLATKTDNVDAGAGVATTGIRVGKEGGGCNSGGPGGLIAVALMAAAVFAVRRRRTA